MASSCLRTLVSATPVAPTLSRTSTTNPRHADTNPVVPRGVPIAASVSRGIPVTVSVSFSVSVSHGTLRASPCVRVSGPQSLASPHVARASLSSCCSSRSASYSSLSVSDSPRSTRAVFCAVPCAVSSAAACAHPSRSACPALPLADERKPPVARSAASPAPAARAAAAALLRPRHPLTSLPLSASSAPPFIDLSSSLIFSSDALRPGRAMPAASSRPLSAPTVRASASGAGSSGDGEGSSGGRSSGGARSGGNGSGGSLGDARGGSEWRRGEGSGEADEAGEKEAEGKTGDGEAEEIDEAERERQEELLRALGLDSSIPETANEFLDKVSSRAYDMRRRLESTLESTSYDVVDSNPWRDPSKALFVLAQGDAQLYTMRTRTPRSEVESELDKLFGERRGRKGGISTGASGKSSSSGGGGGGGSSGTRTASPTRSRFSMKVEDVREGVLVFEDEQQAAQYCSLLEGQGHNCLGVAQFKAKDLFKVCQSSKALAVLFRSGATRPARALLEESELEIATLTAERDSARQQLTVNAHAQSEEPIIISSGTPTQNDSVGQRSGVASEGAAHSMPGMERNRAAPSPREPREARRHVEFAATSGEYDVTAPMPLKPQRPPCFDPSQRGGPTVQLWVFTMNVFFDANYVESDAAKIRYAVSLLRGPAMDWWRVIVTSLRAYEPPSQEEGPTGPAVTWSSFCETAQYSTWDAWCAGLRACFEPIAASISARQKLRTWRQLESVQDYTSSFLALCEQVGYMHEAERVDRYVGGLKPDILHEIMLRGLSNFNEILALAEKIDMLRRPRPRYGSFEDTVMPFGLTNAPATFQMITNEAFRQLLDKCVIIYLDDILVYSRDKQQHLADLEAVFTVLDKHKLLTKGSKCEFFQDRLEFLGHVISEAGVGIEQKTLDTVKAWQPPTNITELQSFLGFVNYVRQFVPDMARLTAPLTDLLRKGVAFTWGEKEHAAFSTLKNVSRL
ncbi:unnamed protein product [Closterium sp. NIES-54]